MSRNINVNPAHYKVAGRERQGEAILQNAEKHAFTNQQTNDARWQAQHGGGAPWETTPPAPLVDTPEERKRSERAEQRAKNARKRAKSSSKRARKPTRPARKTAKVATKVAKKRPTARTGTARKSAARR